MSIFDYFTSKTADELERKPFSPTSYRKLALALNQAGEDAKARYPDDGETVDDFVRALKEICKIRCKKAADGAELCPPQRFTDGASEYAAPEPPGGWLSVYVAPFTPLTRVDTTDPIGTIVMSTFLSALLVISVPPLWI